MFVEDRGFECFENNCSLCLDYIRNRDADHFGDLILFTKRVAPALTSAEHHHIDSYILVVLEVRATQIHMLFPLSPE